MIPSSEPGGFVYNPSSHAIGPGNVDVRCATTPDIPTRPQSQILAQFGTIESALQAEHHAILDSVVLSHAHEPHLELFLPRKSSEPTVGLE
jgi:hypothetical protein